MMAERHRHPPSAYGYSMQLLGTLGWSSLPFLSRIPHDTLVICGDDDPLIPVVNAETLARRIPTRGWRSSSGAATCSCGTRPSACPCASPASSTPAPGLAAKTRPSQRARFLPVPSDAADSLRASRPLGARQGLRAAEI
jgi:hypothetical protein